MPHQVVFTSHVRGIRPGSSGYCTVLHSQEIRPALLKALEEDSVFEHHEGNRGKTVFRFKTLDLRGSQYYVLSRIADAGLDYTGRTNFIAHHLAFAADEIPEYSPAEIFKNWEGWYSVWSGEPRIEDVKDMVFPQERPPIGALAQGWGPLVAAYTLQQIRTKSKDVTLRFPGEDPSVLLQIVCDVLAIEAISSNYRATWAISFSVGSATKSLDSGVRLFASYSAADGQMRECEEITAETAVARDALPPRFLQIAETGVFEQKVAQQPARASVQNPNINLDDRLVGEIRNPSAQGRSVQRQVGTFSGSGSARSQRQSTHKSKRTALIGTALVVLLVLAVAGVFLLREDAASLKERKYQEVVEELARFADENVPLPIEDYERLLNKLRKLSEYPPPRLDGRLLSEGIDIQENFGTSYERYEKIRDKVSDLATPEEVVVADQEGGSEATEKDGSLGIGSDEKDENETVPASEQASDAVDESLKNEEIADSAMDRRRKHKTIGVIFLNEGQHLSVDESIIPKDASKEDIFLEVDGERLRAISVSETGLRRTGYGYGKILHINRVRHEVVVSGELKQSEKFVRIDWPGKVNKKSGLVSIFIFDVRAQPMEFTDVDLDLSGWKNDPRTVFRSLFPISENVDYMKVYFSKDRFWLLDLRESEKKTSPRNQKLEEGLDGIIEEFGQPPKDANGDYLGKEVRLKLENIVDRTLEFIGTVGTEKESNHFVSTLKKQFEEAKKQLDSSGEVIFLVFWTDLWRKYSEPDVNPTQSKKKKQENKITSELIDFMNKELPIDGFEDTHNYKVTIGEIEFSVIGGSGKTNGLHLNFGEEYSLEYISDLIVKRNQESSELEKEGRVPLKDVGKKYKNIESIEIGKTSHGKRAPIATFKIDE